MERPGATARLGASLTSPVTSWSLVAMDITQKKKRKEARRLFLTGACDSNAEIGRRLGLKPHTVAKYRKDEDWDGLRLKMDRHAAEKMALHLASEPLSLN